MLLAITCSIEIAFYKVILYYLVSVNIKEAYDINM